MAPLGPAAQSALLKWINTFPLTYKVESLADLNDGYAISQALADIDPSYQPGSSLRPDTLGNIIKGLFRFIRTKCTGLDSLLDSPGLKAMAEHGHIEQIFEILSLLLMAAISGPNSQSYIMTITGLEPSVQAEIAKIIQNLQEQTEKASSGSSKGERKGNALSNDDFELEFEVRYSSLIAQKKSLEQERDRLKKQLADMTTRLERLQDNNDLLQQRLTATEDSLSSVARDEDSVAAIKSLEAKIREQDELIANQEGQVEQDRGEKSRMRSEIDRLKSASDLVIQLQDEIKELQYQNLELTKKANTVERYKQKLESQRDFQTDIKSLELENEEFKMRSKDYELLKHRNESLEATHVQFQNTLGRREMEIFELSSQKKTIDEEKADLQRAITRLEEMRLADEDHINELQEQLNAKPQSISSPGGTSMGNLEDELEQTAHVGTRNNLEVSRLRAENQLLKGNATAAQEAAALRVQLDEAERIRKREELKYNELFEKHVVASQQVTAILSASISEGLVKGVNAAMLIGKLEVLTPEYYSSEAFANLRKLYLSSSEKITLAEKRIRELEANLENTKRDLFTANTDLSMIEKEDIEALEELKATQELLSSSFEAELKKLQSRYKDLEVDHEQQKSQLIEALLSKDKLQMSVTESQTQDNPKAMTEIVDKARADLDNSEQQIKKQESIVRELQMRIKDLEAGGPDIEKTALEQKFNLLKRENDMMTTAWYDLASRLQSNNVALQRRPEAPRSMIKQQRQAVNAFGRRQGNS